MTTNILSENNEGAHSKTALAPITGSGATGNLINNGPLVVAIQSIFYTVDEKGYINYD
jgi:hypothetical protein